MTEAEWLASEDPAAMLEWAQGAWSKPFTERKLRLFACACCRQVWHLLADPRSREAVEVAERHADGDVTSAELTAAWNAANSAAAAAVAWDSASDAAWAAAGTAASDAARKSQAFLLRDIAGNPFRPVRCRQTLNPLGSDLRRWRAVGEMPDCDCRRLTPDVRDMARAAYDDRDLETGSGFLAADRLAVLADALEDTGCDGQILRHLRGQDFPSGPNFAFRQGPHVRGCWALDLLLGK